MRSRIVLVLVLAVAVALLGVYLGRSTIIPKAAGEPSTATTAGAPVGTAHKPASGSGPVRSPRASSQQTGQTMGSPKAAPPKASPPKAPPPKASTPKVAPPKACSPTAAPQPPVSTIVSDPPPPAADQVYFGQISITSFDDSAQTSISPDYQALTTTFDKFEIELQGKGECDVTRSLSMTLPVTGPAKAGRLGFHVQGFAFTDQGASAQVTLRGNGQVKVKNFPAGSNDTYQVDLAFPVTPGTSYTMSVQLEVHQNPDTGGDAILNMGSIDSGIT